MMSDLPWRLVAPAKDASSAREISPSLVSEFERLAGQLGLACTKDQQARKLYLDLPRERSVVGVVYPSGQVAQRSPQNNAPQYAPARPSAAPLVHAVPDIKVSAHFSLSEFRPKSSAYNAVRVATELVQLLERIRAAAGGPIHITSGYRPPAYNEYVGGEQNSYHMDGWAADIFAPHLTTEQLRVVCERVIGNAGGVGYYPGQGFVHVDVGPYARWEG
jgi:hypothetical protein